MDEADTVNALVPELKSRGIETIVVLIHEGGVQSAPAPYNGCTGISGPIVDIVNALRRRGRRRHQRSHPPAL